jgi:type IV fimbrial biogenesis protein FimT
VIIMKIPSLGFSLIELMITLAIAAIVLAAGVPAFGDLVQDNRLVTQINELMTDLNLARSEAIKQAAPVTVCKRNNAGTDCNNPGNWQDGWIVFLDSNRDGIVDDDGDATPCETGEDDDCVLRVHASLPVGNTLKYPRDRITYDTQGFSYGFNGTFVFCDSRGYAKGRGRIVSNPGRIMATADSNHDGIHEDSSGANFTPASC